MGKFVFEFDKNESFVTLLTRFIDLLYENDYCNKFMHGYYVGSLHHYLFNNSGLFLNNISNEEEK